MISTVTSLVADAMFVSRPLSQEARSLRERAQDIHVAAMGVEVMDQTQVDVALDHLRPLIAHLVTHGDAEEHIVYPHLQGVCGSEITVLLEDHVRIKELGRSIDGWTPEQGRPALRGLLDEFCDITTAHLLVEGEVCMPVVHGRTTRASEQLLFEAVEIEVFEEAVRRADSLATVPPPN